jgi:hypothetical protein
MSPLVTLIATVLATPKVREAIQSLTAESAKAGKEALIRWLKPTAREKAAKKAIELFSHEWNAEMEATTFEMAHEGYRMQLQKLIEIAAAEIAEWMEPETKAVDLSLVESFWSTLHLDPLPADFSWPLVAQTYTRAIQKQFRSDPELRSEFDAALRERTAKAAERTAAAAERLAGIDPGFDLDAYRKFLIEKKCNALQLAALHTSTYDLDRKLVLWSVFVEPSARETALLVDTPPEILRPMAQERQQLADYAKEEIYDKRREKYQSAPIRPIFETLNRERLVVVTGDPGSGKTSLLKYRALQWATGTLDLPLPLLVDLKEYVRTNTNLLQYCEIGREVFRLDAGQLDQLLKSGQAAFYLDGLDEVFDIEKRSSILEEIAVLTSKYSRAYFVLTSRKIGYDPERLRSAGFLHITIEDFDRTQMFLFLRQWHALAEPDETERTLLQVRMERAITDSQSIRELAANPLLLTMMAILNRNQELPRNRVALYREASRVLLDDWDARKTVAVSEFDREDKEALLRDLAGEMQQGDRGLAGNLIDRSRLLSRFQLFLEGIHVTDSHSKAKFLVKQLTERNFILTYAGTDRFRFVHRTFLEYFCAAWFVERVQIKREITFEQLRGEVFGKHWKDEKWHEVLRLIAGMVSAEDAGKLIEFLMAQDGSLHKLSNLMLAAGCLCEVRNRKAIQSTDDALWQQFVIDGVNYEPPIHLRSIEKWELRTSVRETAIHWLSLCWREQRARQWLLEHASTNSDSTLRRVALLELTRAWPRDLDTLNLLKDRAQIDKSYAVRQEAVRKLASCWADSPQTLALLKESAKNDPSEEVLEASIEGLAHRWLDDPEVLPILKARIRGDKDFAIRRAALQALAKFWPNHPDTLLILLEKAKTDSHDATKQAALAELAQRFPAAPETLRLLKDCARNSRSSHILQTALRELVLRWSDDPETLIVVKDRALNDKSYDVRRAAILELAHSWPTDPETLPILKDRALKDRYTSVRRAAARELMRGWPDDPEAVELFRSIL